MKIYTKMGDRGQTMLATGEFVSKSSLRIEAYGSVDELNSHLGALSCESTRSLPAPVVVSIVHKIERIQNNLFDIGAELATPDSAIAAKRLNLLGESETKTLESEIDAWSTELEPLRNFVLPGGHIANAYSHVCRTICRRAERNIIRLTSEASVRSEIIVYLNRLSDWLFQLARICSKHSGTPEILWKKK